MRVLWVLLTIYLIYRVIRIGLFFATRSRRARQDDPEPTVQPPKQSKIIDKNEGEYVDYEEIKK
jgi:hypothetical protein